MAVGTPSKGKAKEELPSTWNLSWTDFLPLVEQPKRPIEWSNSSVIYTAHPKEPAIIGRFFSSSRIFIVPSPQPVQQFKTAFEPPTIISISPDDEWLFAHYPRRTGDSVACLWKRGNELDKWDIREWWSLPAGAGILSVAWLGMNREWEADASGTPKRLPPLGPRVLTCNPVLGLVAENHMFTLCYFRHYIPTLKMVTCSLSHPSTSSESVLNPAQTNLPNGPVAEGDTIKLCIAGAIGLSYNDSSVIIATRLKVLPLPIPQSVLFGTMDLAMPPKHPADVSVSISEPLGEAANIKLCEIEVKFDGDQLTLLSKPIEQSLIQNSGQQLTSLNFVSNYSTPDAGIPPMYLIASFIDFEVSSAPVSEVCSWSVTRSSQAKNDESSWICHKQAARTFSSEVLSFVCPPKIRYKIATPVLFAGLLSTSRRLSTIKSARKQAHLGHLKALNLNDLLDAENWSVTPILASTHESAFPAAVSPSVAISPNSVLLFGLSPPILPPRTWLQSLPRPYVADTGIPSLSSCLAGAVFNPRSITDVISTLSLPSMTDGEVSEILCKAIPLVEKAGIKGEGESPPLTFGILMETFHARSQHALSEDQKKACSERWQTFHDMCSVVAANTAFQDCREDDKYDLTASWHLINFCRWILLLAERIFRTAVLAGASLSSTTEDKDDIFGSDPSSPIHPVQITLSPSLFHLLHPSALSNIKTALHNINHFRQFIVSYNTGNENIQMIKETLNDLVDNSGIDLGETVTLLDKLLEEIQHLPSEDIWKSLITSEPPPTVQNFVSSITRRLSEDQYVNKSLLFIKVDDLVDTFGILSFEAVPKKAANRDVISKGMLSDGRVPSMVCLRCGGRTEIGRAERIAGTLSPTWTLWETTWQKRCICGGSWTKPL